MFIAQGWRRLLPHLPNGFVLVTPAEASFSPWPSALLAVMSPVVLGVFVIRPRVSGPVFGRDGLRVVGGILGFYCIFAILIRLVRRYDLILGTLAVAVLVYRRHGAPQISRRRG